MPPAERPEYKIEVNGKEYRVQGTEQQVKDIAAAIKDIAPDNPDLVDVSLPYNAMVNRLPTSGEAPGQIIESDHSYQPSASKTFFSRLTSAIPFNFGDEIGAAVNAFIPGAAAYENWANRQSDPTAGEQVSGWDTGSSFWDAFKRNQAAYDAQLQAGQNINPAADAWGNIGGALIGAKGLGGLGSGAINLAGRVAPKAVPAAALRYDAAAMAHPTTTAVATAAPLTAGAGYVAGFGAGDTMENRLRSGGQGALVGAPLGAGIGIVTAKALPHIGRLWNAARGRGSEEEAKRQVVMALADDFDLTSPAGVRAAKDALSQFTTKPVTIADITAGVRSRSADALNNPNRGQRAGIDTVMERQGQQENRLVGDVTDAMRPPTPLGADPMNTYAANEALIASRADNAAELKPPALYETTVTPPAIPVYEPPVQPPPPLRPFEEPPAQFADNGPPVTDPAVGPLVPPGFQATLDLQPPVPPVVPVTPPVRTVREAPAAGVERAIGGPSLKPKSKTTKPATITESENAGLLRLLGVESRKPLPAFTDLAENLNARSQQIIAAEREASRAAAEAARARRIELQGMSAERRAAAEAADAEAAAAKAAAARKEAEDIAFHENATQMELPLDQFGRRRGKDQFGPPAPTINTMSPRMVKDPTTNRIIAEDPFAQRALEGAVKLSQRERASAAAAGKPVDDIPEILAGQPLDFRTADYVKRFMDQQINLAKSGRSETFTAAEVEGLIKTRNTLRDRLKAENPEYAKYLDQYSDESQLIDALEEGSRFQRLSPEQIAGEQAKRGPAAREMYQLGAARSVLDDLRGSERGNAADRIPMDTSSRDRRAALGLPENSTARLNEQVEQERQLSLLTGMVNPKLAPPNAPTFIDAAGNVYNPSSPLSVGRAIGRHIADKIMLTHNAKINEDVLKLVLEQDKKTQAIIIDELAAAGKKTAADNLRRVLKARERGVKGGLIIGSPVSLQEEQ